MAGHEEDVERRRLGLLESVDDPGTIQHLTELGLSTGWRCLEIGAGGGSVARWMAERVGPDGYVVATDIDTRNLDGLSARNLGVRRHDIAVDDLDEQYDLVHCRNVLMHVSDRDAALERMVSAVCPGGLLLIEEKDVSIARAVDDSHPLAANFTATVRKDADFLSGTVATDFGYALPAMFLRAGLREVDYELVGRIETGGGAWAQMFQITTSHIAAVLLANGVLSEDEIADQSRALDDPTFQFLGYLNIAVWGRRTAE
jgi:ubiquinone/menaquinone biosynthesis C-methylase UbiE